MLPHSIGSVPEMLLSPSCNDIRDGKAMLPPQEGGMLPDNGIPYRTRVEMDGKAPAPAQE